MNFVDRQAEFILPRRGDFFTIMICEQNMFVFDFPKPITMFRSDKQSQSAKNLQNRVFQRKTAILKNYYLCKIITYEILLKGEGSRNPMRNSFR